MREEVRCCKVWRIIWVVAHRLSSLQTHPRQVPRLAWPHHGRMNQYRCPRSPQRDVPRSPLTPTGKRVGGPGSSGIVLNLIAAARPV